MFTETLTIVTIISLIFTGLTWIYFFKRVICEICGRKMYRFKHGGVDFYTCDFCDNIKEIGDKK